MSRNRLRLLRGFVALALFASFTALSQLSADWRYDCPDTYLCRPISLFTREELLTRRTHTLPPLENGDILLTFSTHTFGWRHGHAGLVVDAEQGLVLEAQQLGSPSSLAQAEHWSRYPTLQVLRLKDADSEVRQAAAAYAAGSLAGLPYRLSSGLLPARGEEIASVQCAYLVWCAYSRQGWDLDGDGGRLVTVADLASSPLLERIY